MKTVVLGPPPVALAELIAHRRATGADRYDEVWRGEYHMAPAPHGAHADIDDQLAALLRPLARRIGLFSSGPVNLGDPSDYRVPDRAVHRQRPAVMWFPTAAIVVEIVSPDDETWARLPFYAARGVDELVIVDPQQRTVVWLRLIGSDYRPLERSMLGITSDELRSQLDWPTLGSASPEG